MGCGDCHCGFGCVSALLVLVFFLTFQQTAWSIDMTGGSELHRISLSKNEGVGSLISGQADTGQKLLGDTTENNKQYDIGKPPNQYLSTIHNNTSVSKEILNLVPSNTSANVTPFISQAAEQNLNSSLPSTNLNQGDSVPLKSGNTSFEAETITLKPNSINTMLKDLQKTTHRDNFVRHGNLSSTSNINSVIKFSTSIGADRSKFISTTRPLPREQSTATPSQDYPQKLPTVPKKSTFIPDNSDFQDKQPESNVILGNKDRMQDKYEDLKTMYTTSPASVQSDLEDLFDGKEGHKDELGNEEKDNEWNNDFWNEEEKKGQYLHVSSVNSVQGGEDEPDDADDDKMVDDNLFDDEDDDSYNEDNEDKENYDDEYYKHGGLADDKLDDRPDDVKDMIAEELGAPWREKATLVPPFIKEDLITPQTFSRDDRIEKEIGLMTFYSWILFIVFVLISMYVFFRHRHAVRAYWNRARGTKYNTNLSQAEEGKSLMKNVYA